MFSIDVRMDGSLMDWTSGLMDGQAVLARWLALNKKKKIDRQRFTVDALMDHHSGIP